MTGKNISSFKSYLNFTHKFEVDIDGKFHKEGRGESVFGEKFSPLPGYLFQLRILNLDTKRFCVYLINRGEEEAKISTFKVKSVKGNYEAEENNFSLLPGESRPVSDFLFNNFYVYKEFYCHLAIEFSEKVLKLFKDEDASGFPEDFAREKDDPTFADVTLVCEEEKIPCHRFVLAAKSEVFKKMFSQDFKEAGTQEASISGLKLPTLKAMVNFMYTNKVNPEGTDLTELFSAAHQYFVLDLRRKCENLLVEDLSTSNAVKYFQLASLHNGSKLKTAAMDVIAKNYQIIRESQEWAQLEEESNAAVEILDHVMKYKSSRN